MLGGTAVTNIRRGRRQRSAVLTALAVIVIADVVIDVRLRRDFAKTARNCAYREHMSVLGPLGWGGVLLGAVAVLVALKSPRRTWGVALASTTMLVAVGALALVTHCGSSG